MQTPQKFQKHLAQSETQQREDENSPQMMMQQTQERRVEGNFVDRQLKLIIDMLLVSKLKEAERLIEEGFVHCRLEAQNIPESVTSKDKFKQQVRAFATYRLTHKLSSTIAQFKQQIAMLQPRLQEPDTKKQTDDLMSKIASYSNALIILQLPPSQEVSLPLKRAYLQFALNQNIKLKNFSATSKIVHFYRKQIPFDQSESSQLEKAKVDQIEVTCKKYGEKNMSSSLGYYGADCPSCSEPLIFGLATPQCHKCKVKIGVCYTSLRPVVSEMAPRCNLCLARFHGDQLTASNLMSPTKKSTVCPICTLSKIDI